MTFENNGEEVQAAEIQQAGQGQLPNQDLVNALKAILADAEKGNIQGMAFVRVIKTGAFNVFSVGPYLIEFHAGADLIMDGCKDVWKAQLNAQIQQAQQRGLQRATMADLSNLPAGFGRGRVPS